MADVVQSYLAGRAAAQAESEHQQALQDSQLRQQILKHQLNSLKLEDQLRARDLATQTFRALNGLPASDLQTEEVPGQVPNLPSASNAGIVTTPGTAQNPTSGLPSVVSGLVKNRLGAGLGTSPMPAGVSSTGVLTPLDAAQSPDAGTHAGMVSQPRAIQIPAVVSGDVNLPALSLRPQTAEDLTARQLALTQAQDALKPITIPAGGRVVIPGTGQTFSGGPPQNEFGQFQQIFAEQNGGSSFNDLPTNVKQQFPKWYAVNRQDPQTRALLIALHQSEINQKNQGFASLPAWALDSTRASGPQANVMDPTLGLTPNGLWQAVQTYIKTFRFPPTGIGNNPKAWAVRQAVINKAGAIAADAGMDLPTMAAFFKANEGSLDQQLKFYDSASSFLRTADKNSQPLDDLLQKIPDTGSPIFNQPLRAFSTHVAGDPTMSSFATYLTSVRNEYAKILRNPNLSGQLTDQASAETKQLLDPNATVGQMIASLQALRQEGDNRLISIGDQIQRIQKRMGRGGGAPDDSTTQPVQLKQTKLPNGQIVVTAPDGDHYFSTQKAADNFKSLVRQAQGGQP